MPAEWEAHDALWLALPHDRQEWGAFFDEAYASVIQIATAIAHAPGAEAVNVLCRKRASDALPAEVTQHLAQYGDIWLRDTGPIFLQEEGAIVAQAFAFNGWGGKFQFPHDAEIAATIAALANCPLRRASMVLEGGAVDCDGQGSLLTTRQCLLNANRNPGLGQHDIEQLVETHLGCTKVLWLSEGLLGDHTDGHVDNIARFVAPGQVVCMRPSDAGEPNADILRDIERRLRHHTDAMGRELEVIALPSPGHIEGSDGIMAASYCNFLLTNACVLVPVFDRPSDIEALAIFSDLFPSRTIVPIASYALLTGGGTLHCISREQPSKAVTS